MSVSLRIDFVSDIACPWCAVGLASLQQALSHCRDQLSAELHFQPFELNPGMPPEGEDVGEHLARKYGSTPERQAEMRAMIAERGAAVGFRFNPDGRSRIVNTFNAHRLLYWAGTEDDKRQLALKQALLEACHGRDQRVDHDAVLLAAVEQAGLDANRARQILASDEFANEVRAAERQWQEAGIHAVPAVVIERRHVISGAQTPDVFEQALRRLARGDATAG
ncbi:MAG: DsbA family oxidoreductase [Pseudomonadales bacterium]|jgi:predicted DsbA family dithiol-disulfide isomerase|nr:DsbA family oxidoreductase [Pseudomonadales bacterium]MCP5320050.1 DsbA family oxidoreductase [Pseudomonadales bacterium]